MVYIASNAAMIHAFRLDGVSAVQGTEWWAYIPRAKLHKQPALTQELDGHQADDLMRTGQTYVNDGRLSLEHVWLDGYMNGLTGCTGPGYFPAQADRTIDTNGCEWHRVLTWAGGYGATHYYALDVTNPDAPRFLWERSDESTSGTGKGRAIGAPAVASFWDSSGVFPKRRWIAFWGGGGQRPGVSATSPATDYAQAAVYIHDLDSSPTTPPTTYQTSGFNVSHPGISNQDPDVFEEYVPPEYGMFGTPAVADLDGDASADVAYIGDSLGYVTKVLFNEISPNSPTRCIFGTPSSSDLAKHIYYPPSLFYTQSGDLNVFYGSGSPYNVYDAVTGGLYAFKDPSPYGCAAGVPASCTTNSSLFSGSTFYQFSGTGEKIVGAPTTRFGRMFFATHIPGSDLCTLGSSRLYGLNVDNCEGGLFDDTADSYNVVNNLYTEVTGLISEPVFANGQLYALNIDSGGLDANSVIDDFSVTPDNFVSHVYMSFRHVF
jgi:Tfp pilus tip-associated adhesin PilY1